MFHKEISSARSDSSEAKGPSNIANSCSTLSGTGSDLAVTTQSDGYVLGGIQILDKSPFTQLPSSTNSPISDNTKIETSLKVPDVVNPAKSIPRIAVNNVYLARENSLDSPSLSSYGTIKLNCGSTPDAPIPVPHRPKENVDQARHNSVNLPNTSLPKEVQHNPFLDFNNPNLTYLPYNEELESNLVHTNREYCNLPLDRKFLSTSARNAESKANNSSGAFFSADRGSIQGQFGNVAHVNLSATSEKIKETQTRYSENVTALSSNVAIGAPNSYRNIAQGSTSEESDIQVEGSSSVAGAVLTSSRENNPELRSQFTKYKPSSAFLSECNTVFSSDHDSSVDSGMEVYSASKQRGSLQEFSGAATPLLQTLPELQKTSLNGGLRLIRYICNACFKGFSISVYKIRF